MKAWSKFLIFLGMLSWVVAPISSAPATRPEVTAAIQAIQQASDPSAVISAYANGFAIDRNDPKLYEAYVARMVDLGLPELAYYKAQTVTMLESNSGLGWRRVAYVNARRAQLAEAMSSVILAGKLAPQNNRRQPLRQ